MIRLLLLAASLLSFAEVARAQTCIVQANGDCMLEPSAAQGDDVSPYCFLPSLARGQYETSYAFSAVDDEGACHNFETYLRFALPADLLEPGETVTTARLLLYYAFTFGFDGPAPTLPHAPITVHVSEVSSAWTEDAVTWANRPGFVSPPAASLSNVTNLGVKEFIVTDLVRAWAHGTKPNRGFAVTSPNDIPFGMNSWEADPAVPPFQKARLRITVGPGAPPTPVPLFPY
jgi:hypothetical protein